MLTEHEARQAAENDLKKQNFEVVMVTRNVVETKRSWIFETVSATGEMLVGNAPLVVDKQTATIKVCRKAWMEFETELGAIARIQRWWHRCLTY